MGVGSWTAKAEEQCEKGSHTVRTGRLPVGCQANASDTSVSRQSDGAPPSPRRASPGDGKDDNPSEYEMVEARHFNSLVSPFPIVPIALAAGLHSCRALVQEFKSNSVSKYSPYHILDGEAYWYQHAPPAAQKHIPALISCKIQVRTSAEVLNPSWFAGP